MEREREANLHQTNTEQERLENQAPSQPEAIERLAGCAYTRSRIHAHRLTQTPAGSAGLICRSTAGKGHE